MPELLPLLLLLTPILAALACFLPAFEAEVEGISITAAGLILVFSALLLMHIAGTGGSVLRHALLVDALSGVLLLIVAPAGAVALIVSRPYLRTRHTSGGPCIGSPRRYYALLHCAISCMLLTCLASNLALLWLAITLPIVPFGLLIAGGGGAGASGATYRYTMRGLAAAAPALLGTMLIALAARLQLGTSFAALDWPGLHRVAGTLDPSSARLSFVLAAGGFAAMGGMLPLQTRLPDIARRLPAPAAALALAGGPSCALYAILRFHSLIADALGPGFSSHLLLAFGLAGSLCALPVLLTQQDIVRLIAYAVMTMMGLTTAAVGLTGDDARFGALLGLLNLAIAALIALSAAGGLPQPSAGAFMAQLYGIGHTQPLRTRLVYGGLLALGAAPLTAGFLGAFEVLTAAFDSASWLPAGLMLVLFTATPIAIAWRGRHLLASTSSPRYKRDTGEAGPAMDNLDLWPVGLLLATLIVVGIHVPGGLVTLLRHAVAIVGGAG